MENCTTELTELAENRTQFESIKTLYLYGTPPLICFCIISVIVNIKILISIYWIKRPISPTLYISLSLAAADAFSSTVLGIVLILNSFIPNGLGIALTGLNCFLLGLEAVRLGSIMITVSHLMALAVNHYLGILKPLHYVSIMTHRNVTIILAVLWIVPLSFFLAYFSLVENEGFQSYECKVTMFLLRQKFRILFSSLFFAPFFFMVCIYTHIFCIVKRHQAYRRNFSSIRKSENETDSKNSQQMMKNVKAVHTTLYILGSFVIGWIPATIVYILICEDCILHFNWASPHTKFFVFSTLYFLISLKTLVNPIIYTARMHEIKFANQKMKASLLKCIGFTDQENEVHTTRQLLSKSTLSKLMCNNNHKEHKVKSTYV